MCWHTTFSTVNVVLPTALFPASLYRETRTKQYAGFLKQNGRMERQQNVPRSFDNALDHLVGPSVISHAPQ